ncbi:MAG TPA: xanthine dehydrogenase family protein subunit M [Gammaproteobacteria bacterium]|nr:xanthine dehydrogenase family protein subunit M [Gammaproteobacteria bacterium]
MSRDMMGAFELYQPDSVDGAVELLQKFGEDGWALAGGNDSLDWFKDRIKRPKYVVDLGGITALKGIRESADGGVEIGALTTLTEVERSELIMGRYRVLADAARRVASPQIRNTGTIGGNVCQDARCWYYRYGVNCYRAGGNRCYADTPEGQNREHCLFGADRCVAVSPSDTAPALVVLDAKMVVVGPKGQREVPAEQFFIGPNVDITRMTALEDGEVLTAIRLPMDWSGARFYFEKVADRNTWDFPLVNIAAAMVVTGDKIDRIRIAAGAVQCVPRRLTAVEAVVTGQPKNAETAGLAGQSAVRGATPLNFNHFKIPLLQNLVTRAIRDA